MLRNSTGAAANQDTGASEDQPSTSGSVRGRGGGRGRGRGRGRGGKLKAVGAGTGTRKGVKDGWAADDTTRKAKTPRKPSKPKKPRTTKTEEEKKAAEANKVASLAQLKPLFSYVNFCRSLWRIFLFFIIIPQELQKTDWRQECQDR